MAANRKTKTSFMRSRMATVVLCLCLLAAAGVIGTYVVSKNEQRLQEQRQQELAQKEAEAQRIREQAKAEEEAQEKEQEERRQAASANVRAKVTAGVSEKNEQQAVTPRISEEERAALNAAAEEAARRDRAASEKAPAAELHFSPETDELLWPVKGNVILDYSMDRTVYFATLEQYKYNPAILIQAEAGQDVICSRAGKVTDISQSDETGTTVTVDFGDGFQGIYGQLQNLSVKDGNVLQQGDRIGSAARPSRYYTKEGTHVFFEVTKDGNPIDPMDLLQ